MRKSALLYVNGQRLEIPPEHARMMLADYLRQVVRLTGTKIVCAEGDCGACTVLRNDSVLRGAKSPRFIAVNSCLMTVAQLDGSSLVTVDALAEEALTPVQSAMMNCHGSQCGFCTPGFVMALTGLVEDKLSDKKATKAIDGKEAKNATTGNLCRCTGYQPIVDAAVSVDLERCESVTKRFWTREQARDLAEMTHEALELESEHFVFYAPTKLSDAVKFLKKHSEARVLAAATDLGVVHNKWKRRLDHVLSLHLIRELYVIEPLKRGRLRVGARATLTELRQALKDKVPEFARFLDIFASPQIKNVATLVGNVANASPIADTPPFLLVMDAIVEVVGPKGKREIPIEDFFLAYRKTALRPGEIIVAITLSTQSRDEVLSVRKVSERKDLDISSVNAAFRLNWADQKKAKIKSIKIAYGGVAATAIRLKKTEKLLEGCTLAAADIEAAAQSLQTEMTPIADVRGSAVFRRVLAENLLRRFLGEVR